MTAIKIQYINNKCIIYVILFVFINESVYELQLGCQCFSCENADWKDKLITARHSGW